MRIGAALADIVGIPHVLAEPQSLLVRPGTTEEVARCLALLSAERIPVVTVGGRTGLVDATRAEA